MRSIQFSLNRFRSAAADERSEEGTRQRRCRAVPLYRVLGRRIDHRTTVREHCHFEADPSRRAKPTEESENLDLDQFDRCRAFILQRNPFDSIKPSKVSRFKIPQSHWASVGILTDATGGRCEQR